MQLAADGEDNTTAGGFPEIRWAQTANYGYVPNVVMQKVFMAVAMDLGDPTSPYGSVHPRDKEDVGTRLVLAAAAVAYGNNNLYYTGPIPYRAYISIGVTNMRARVSYKNVSTTLKILSPYGFEVACTDSSSEADTWLEGVVSSAVGNDVNINFPLCPAGSRVRMVRYAWRQHPCSFKMCSVYSGGLPSPPFLIPVTVAKRDWHMAQADVLNTGTDAVL